MITLWSRLTFAQIGHSSLSVRVWQHLQYWTWDFASVIESASRFAWSAGIFII